jgi:hypothetical protein
VAGETSFFVTISDTEDPAEVDISLSAQVLHPVSLGLAGGASADVRFDQIPPSLEIQSPDPALGPITMAADENNDPSDGLQISVSGSVTGTGGDGTELLELFADGVSIATTSPDGGSFTFSGATVSGDGAVELSVSVTDTCGLAGTAAITVDIFANTPALVIQSPANGTTLKALADEVPGTTDVFDGTFKVAAADATDGSVLVVECRAAGSAGVFEPVGSTTIDADALPEGGVFSVAVALSVATLSHDAECRASISGPNPTESALVTLVIGVPGPSMVLSAPAADAKLTSATVTFSGTATGLDGQDLTVTVLPAAGGAAVCTATGSGIAAGVVSVTIDLDAECGGLADGAWFLQLDATDNYGNALSDLAGQPTVTVRIDRTAPALVRLTPADLLDPANVAEHADVAPDALNPGYQADFEYRMDSETDATGATICLTINGDSLGCKAVDPLTFKASWKRVTLSSGLNDVVAVGTDGFGNESTLTQVIELILDAPVVKITSPTGNVVTNKPTIDIKVRVTDTGGLPLTGASVSLQVDGAMSPLVPIANGDGTYTFAAVPLVADTAVQFQAVAVFSGTEGASGIRMITYKTTKPTVAISGLTDGQVLTLASAECLGTAANCTLPVKLVTTNAEDGSTATLGVDCIATSGDKTYNQPVANNEASIASVLLIHGGTCTLTPKVLDLAGQLVTGAAVSVSVDRVAPKLLAFINPVGDKLLFNQDANANAADGMQHPLNVRVTGVEAGQVVSVTLTWNDSTLGPQTLGPLLHTVTSNVADGTPYVAPFESPAGAGSITYPEGTITLTATVSDAAGNSALLAKTVLVESFAPTIRIVFPVYLGGISCGPSTACPGGSCFEGNCWTQWGIAETKQVRVTVGGLVTETDNVRVCSNHASLAGGTACASAGYFEVERVSVGGSDAIISLGGQLPSGYQTLVAEAQAEVGGAWAKSLDEVGAFDRFRRVFVDEIAPTVSSLQITSDTLAPLGTLNIAEQFAPGRTYRVRVATSEDATVDIYVNSVLRASGTTSGGVALLSVVFDQGVNTVYAVARDGANNKSALPPASPSLTVTVDTKVPSLVFTNPTKSPVLASDSLNVTLESDTAGAVVALFDGITEIGSETVAGGTVSFSHAVYGALSEGPHTLSATVTSPAGNFNSTETTPVNVLVDTLPPSAVIIAPTHGASLSEADDASAATAGFQLAVDFSTADGATAWEIWAAVGCDGSYAGCSAPTFLKGGAVANAGGAEPTAQVTITIPTAVSNQRIIVRVRDAAGNTKDESVGVTFTVADCLVNLLGLPAGSWFNGTLCPNGVSCASASLPVQGEFIGPCGAVTELRLLNGAAQLDSKEPTGSGADFTLALNDGATLNLELKAFAGAVEVGSTGLVARTVDFTPPTVDLVAANVAGFVTPASAAAVTYNASLDASVAAGFQGHLALAIDDNNVDGGSVQSVVASVGGVETALAPNNVTLPLTLAGPNPTAAELRNLNYEDQATSVVTVTVLDAAGNPGTVSFTATVDIIAPAAVVLDAIDPLAVDARLPAVPLTWNAVADNGSAGAPAAAYDIRYSRSPILTEDQFDDACQVSALVNTAAFPTPGAPGAAEGLTVEGPDPRPRDVAENGKPCKFNAELDGPEMWFAVRVQDAAGNWSLLDPTTPSVSTSAIGLEIARVIFSDTFKALPGMSLANFLTTGVAVIGDVDGDGSREIAVGSNTTNAVCIIYGGAIPDSLTIDTLNGATHACVTGAGLTLPPGTTGTVAQLGTMINRIGDVNGDGLADFGVTGRIGSPVQGFMAIFLGRQDIGPDLTKPNVFITGADPDGNVPYGAACSAGNFDGDSNGANPIFDLAIGEPATARNRIHIIRGDATWTAVGPTPTQLLINLDVPADFAARVGLTITAAATLPRFASRCQRAGNLLPTPGGGAAVTNDLLVAQTGNDDGRLFVIPGRPLPASPLAETLTDLGGVKTDEDNRSVRLRQDAGVTAGNGFATAFEGIEDLTGDGLADVLIGMTTNTKGREIYVFDGATIPTKVGLDFRVNGTVQVGQSWVGTGGYALEVDIAGGFRGVAAIGDFDGFEVDGVSGPLPTADIIYGLGGQPFNTSAELRMNQETDSGTVELGLYPYRDALLVNPFVDPALFTFGPSFDGGFDLTGDGRPDIVVGSGVANVYLIK